MGLLDNITLAKPALDAWAAVQADLQRVKDAPGFSWKVALWKGAKSFGGASLTVMVTGFLVWFVDPAHLGPALVAAGLSEPTTVALIPLLIAAGKVALNWVSNHDDAGRPATTVALRSGDPGTVRVSPFEQAKFERILAEELSAGKPAREAAVSAYWRSRTGVVALALLLAGGMVAAEERMAQVVSSPLGSGSDGLGEVAHVPSGARAGVAEVEAAVSGSPLPLETATGVQMLAKRRVLAAAAVQIPPYFGDKAEPLPFPRALIWGLLPKTIDWYSTGYCIDHSTSCREANPIQPSVEQRVARGRAPYVGAAALFYHTENSDWCRDEEGETRFVCKLPRYLWASLHVALGIHNFAEARK